MPDWGLDWWALGGAVTLCIAMALAEGALSAGDLPKWLASLSHPRLYPPLWVWVLVAVLTYLIQGFVAYRLLLSPIDVVDGIALASLICVMAANIAYNVVLERRRAARFAFTGLLWFLPPLAVLQAALVVADPLSAAVHAAYVIWVVGFDLPIMHALWRRNR